MLKVNEFKFYELGQQIHPLIDAPTNARYSEVWWTWYDARALLDQIFRERPLHVARQSAIRLYAAITAVVPPDFTEAVKKMASSDDLLNDPDADTVSEHLTYEIREAAKQFETILSAEVQVLDTYLVSQKGSYRTQDLIERAEIVFPEAIRDALPASTISDVQQAGRCIALDIPTGAGFHLLRAIEGVMAMYYGRVLGADMPTRMRNWGIYIKKLRDSGKANEKVVGFLDHIRANYRNPITHPEVILTTDEAEILLGVTISVVRQMVLEMWRIEAEAKMAAAVAPPPAEATALPPQEESTPTAPAEPGA